MAKDIIKLPTRKYANYFFAVSCKAGRWLFGNRLYKEGKVQIWPNAIDARKFYYNMNTREEVRKVHGWDGKYVVMHVGNFTPPKNHPFILKVFNELHQRDESSILVLVGTGEESNIKHYIEEYSLQSCVNLLGTRTDVDKLLQGADVFLFPSIFEGLPGALVEAQASGLPCVMSDAIAEEVRICPNLAIHSLKESTNEWVNSLLCYKTFNRKDTRRFIEMKGYDIHSLTNKLCQFYEDSSKKGEEENESL